MTRLNIYPLEQRRLRGDLIETYKILTGKEDVDASEFFQRAIKTDLRGHEWKLFRQRSRLNVRKHFFTQRVVNFWNALPSDVVKANSNEYFQESNRQALERKEMDGHQGSRPLPSIKDHVSCMYVCNLLLASFASYIFFATLHFHPKISSSYKRTKGSPSYQVTPANDTTYAIETVEAIKFLAIRNTPAEFMRNSRTSRLIVFVHITQLLFSFYVYLFFISSELFF